MAQTLYKGKTLFLLGMKFHEDIPDNALIGA